MQRRSCSSPQAPGELGGGKWAETVAALCVLTGGVFLGIGTTLSTGALEPLAGLFCAYALIRIIRDGEERWWLALGVAAGIALQAKYLIAFWLAGLGLGSVATPARRSLLSPYLYGGITLAALIALPNILWQATHGWPFVELGRVAVARKNVVVPPLDSPWQTVEQFNDAAALVWLVGLVGFAFWKRFADLRLFAVAFVAFVAAMIVLHGKTYYLANALPVLIAGGAVALEAWLAPRILRLGLTTAIVAIGLVGAPFALPILPVAQFAVYQRALGIAPHREEEQGQIGVLSQYYADMFGWPELAGRVAEIYRSLTPDERKQAVFLGNNYGEAAAIDVFGRSLGLPPAISGHNNYYLWGPRGHDGSVVIRLGGKLRSPAQGLRLVHGRRYDRQPVGNAVGDRPEAVGLPRPASADGQGLGELQALWLGAGALYDHQASEGGRHVEEIDRQAINEAIAQEMRRDPRVIVMGEDIAGGTGTRGRPGRLGRALGVTKGLFGRSSAGAASSTRRSPRSAFVGAAAGAAATGLRPVVELMFVDFMGVCFDQIFNQAAKFRYMFGGKAMTPLVVRTMIGAGFRAASQHSQCLYPIFTHIPGLKVRRCRPTPTTPRGC